ncbi:MAG: di-heme oxidoredictase family protein [Alphaproteobacteria bacterium]|nr:di-heme oxidoredictase family protein [Alphaproteobacteria bacterium]
MLQVSRWFFGLALCFALLVPLFSLTGEAKKLFRSDLDAGTLVRVKAVTRPVEDFSTAEPFENMPGGATTQNTRFDRDAFSLPAANLSFQGRFDFALGNGGFRKLWVSAPSSTAASDGLGPLFNSRSCQNCHLKDGRGHPPLPGLSFSAPSFIVALSIPDPGGGQRPEPSYGVQLQDFAVSGVLAEGFISVTYKEKKILLSDGEFVSLRVPSYRFTRLAHGPMRADVMFSPRVAPQMIGLGLIEAICDEDILAKADQGDADNDGISGVVSTVVQANRYGSRIGRFGLKATKAGVRQQVATAFFQDMGLSTSLINRPHGDCMEVQKGCLAAPSGSDGGGPEVSPALFELVEFYSRHLAVPARRGVSNKQVLRGKAVFYRSGCISCHTPKYVTSNSQTVPKELRKQLIWPYTDLLLHDMGVDLADHRPDGTATGREWRTPPLWGIGLTRSVSGHTFFLHDGRARNLLEALLWHGGEARKSREAVIGLKTEDRAALLRFLESL